MLFRQSALLAAFAAAANAFTVEEVAVPETGVDKHANIGTSAITVGDTTYATSYINILRSGDEVNGVVFGAVIDENGEQIMAYPMDTDYVETPLGESPGTEPLISNIPDFTSLIRTDGPGASTEFAMFAHFETPLPSTIYRINVDFNSDCTLAVNSLEAVDWSAWGGLWEPCSAKVTPWNTHLGSEEHEPDAKLMTYNYADFVAAYEEGDPTAKNIMHFMRYYGLYSANVTDDAGMDALRAKFNPYKFGHVTELSVADDGTTKAQKWYTTGRVSIENPEIMPDEKTVYIADDADYGVLTRFVMDTPGDMSSGTLYAANFTQVPTEEDPVAVSRTQATKDGGSFEVSWIELGKGTHDELVTLADTMTFDQIFEFADPDEMGECAEGFTYVIVGWWTKEECLKLKPGMEKAAAFFETRRYASMMGATCEMQSTEGLASVGPDNKFYLAMSKIANGMDVATEPAGHIGVPANKCGCVYEFDVNDQYELTFARALICGEETPDPVNSCSTDSIASPDNLFYTGTFGTEDDHSLLIAEDTSYHQNDYLWHYDLKSGNMTRILSTVYGSQVTSPAYYSDGQGCYLLMAVVPHPYKKSDQDMLLEAENMGLMGNVGYIGPIGVRSEL